MLINFLGDQNKIFYNFCAIQGTFYIMFMISEPFILAAMSYDHYVVICNPLLYTVIMSKGHAGCWGQSPMSLLITIKNFNLSSVATM